MFSALYFEFKISYNCICISGVVYPSLEEGRYCMKKKILSLIIALCMLLTFTQPVLSVLAAGGVWNGGTAVPSLSGGYYQIASAENLAWFASQVNSGSSSIKAKLTADISLNEEGSKERVWTPIGTESSPFKGEFDGNGFTISGLFVDGSNDYSGLFGYVYADKPNVDDNDNTSETIFVAEPVKMIYNLKVTNASVSGGQNVGGIAGYIHYAIISGCSFSGTVNGANNSVGGICGYAFNYSVVEQCYSEGSVSGVIRVGGILGYANVNSKVSECYSKAAVASRASLAGNAGGICGIISAGSVENCYFLGSVTGPKRVGGIVGSNTFSTIQGCYVIAPVTSTIGDAEYIAAVAGYSLSGIYYNCYYHQPSTHTSDANAVARTLDEMKKFSFVRELNENGSSYTYDYMVINNSYPVLAWSLETAVWAGGKKKPQTDSAGYYLLGTADELAWFAALVNGKLAGVQQNTAAKARVTDNILLNIFIKENSEDTNVWTPIGSASAPFNGIFIGGGYNIAGVYTNGTTNQGLFGYVGENGTVTETVVIDGLITGTENTGAVAGYNKGIVSLSCNSGTVRGVKATGGVVGYNTGTIQNSYNVGEVYCNSETGLQVGGIAGYNTRAKIKQCFNNGYVTGAAGANYFGGIVGYNSGDGIYNCYNAGEILGGFYIGGLVGFNSSGIVRYSYNRGVVNTKNAVNGNVNNFIGYNNGTCTIDTCYYDSSIEGSVMNNANGATPKATDEMTGSTASSRLGLQSGIWSNRGDDSYFRYYPQIMELYGANYEKARTDSLDSVRIVKSDYNLKVKINGQAETYYPDFDSAVSAVGTNNATIIPVRNITVNSTVNIPGKITIHGEGIERTILRGASFKGTMFNVTGTLTLGDSKNGLDSDTLLYIDGNGQKVQSTASFITLGENAVLNTYAGFSLRNNSTTAKGSAVYIDSGATVNIHGGKIESNTSSADGGAIYNNMGTVNMSGGYLSQNTSSLKGGAVYNNYGTVNISGGEVKGNYGKTLGGAVYNIGNDAEVNISDEASISENSSNTGGAVYVNSGAVNISGGTLSKNFAYNKRGASATAGGGGAVAIAAAGTVNMTGGTISDNYVYNNVGDGFGMTVYGTLNMSGSAAITNNDVYLAKNKTISVVGTLSSPGTAATITPSTYSTSTVVLSGSSMGVSYKKFEITPKGSSKWNVNSSGYLMDTEIVPVASLSKFGAYSVDYVSVAQAVAAVAAGESGIITVTADNTIDETIKVVGDVTILSETDQTFTSMRGGSFSGTMFEVEDGGTLSLGYTNMETPGVDVSPDDAPEEELSQDSIGGEYHIDGGYTYNGAAGTAIINVKKGGTLFTYNDVIIENGNSVSSGTIIVGGTMHMYGGTIRNNIAANGGAINVAYTGEVTLYGGTITGNTVKNGGHGSAIYSAGSLVRAANVYEYYKAQEVVATQNSFVTITDDNDVYLASGTVLNLADKKSAILLSDDAAVPETSPVTASVIYLTAPSYYKGMPILTGKAVSYHYSSFAITDEGFYILPDGTVDLNLLVTKESSTLKIDRDKDYISGVDMSKDTAEYFKSSFINTDKIEVCDLNGNVLSGKDKVGTGCKINLYNSDGTQIIDTVSVLIYGDVDGDGYIDARDSIYIAAVVQRQLDSEKLSAVQIAAADVDFTGTVTDADVQYVIQCGLLTHTVDQYS